MSVVLGVDSSTRSTKVEARRIDTGEVLAVGRAPHPPTTPPTSEQDPRAWWDALVAACAKIGDVRHEVSAISIAGQQHGLVLLDESGEPVRPATLWNDTTSAPEAAALVESVGAEAWADAVGSVPVASFTLTKLAWVANHEPEAFARATMAMLPHDYLTWRLCGEHVTDRGDASGTCWYDVTNDVYRPDLFDVAGLDGAAWIERLPKVLGPTDTAGTITSAAADALGLPPGTLVGPGSGDNMGAALGLGLDAGDLVMSLGTSGTAYAVSDTPANDASGLVAGFADASGRYLPLVATLNATKVTETVARWLGVQQQGLNDLARQAEGTGPVLVPYFDGERTPNLPDASGTFVGLRNDTTREQLALAAHDGVLCGLFQGIDALAAAGVDPRGTLHLIGGGAHSRVFRQRCADLWGRAILVPADDETVATGGAVQAAAIASGQSVASFKAAWNLGAGTLVDTAATDGQAVRDRYAEAARSVPASA